jgi:hypothetical protein
MSRVSNWVLDKLNISEFEPEKSYVELSYLLPFDISSVSPALPTFFHRILRFHGRSSLTGSKPLLSTPCTALRAPNICMKYPHSKHHYTEYLYKRILVSACLSPLSLILGGRESFALGLTMRRLKREFKLVAVRTKPTKWVPIISYYLWIRDNPGLSSRFETLNSHTEIVKQCQEQSHVYYDLLGTVAYRFVLLGDSLCVILKLQNFGESIRKMKHQGENPKTVYKHSITDWINPLAILRIRQWKQFWTNQELQERLRLQRRIVKWGLWLENEVFLWDLLQRLEFLLSRGSYNWSCS